MEKLTTQEAVVVIAFLIFAGFVVSQLFRFARFVVSELLKSIRDAGE
jgi:hypothetical protein